MSYKHYAIMSAMMVGAGMLSTMNVWAEQWDDIRFSLNDLYMILLMTGWMLLFMGAYDGEGVVALVGLVLVVKGVVCIRTQAFIGERQYLRGMIPHHSMAVHMTKKLLGKATTVRPELIPFLENIVRTQEEEIRVMKGGFK